MQAHTMFQPLCRDDTIHGESYYLASEVDAVLGAGAIAPADPMKAAFEAKYHRDWEDPAGDEMKAIWADAWAAAKAVQQPQSLAGR
jgi:hypothetical protein